MRIVQNYLLPHDKVAVPHPREPFHVSDLTIDSKEKIDLEPKQAKEEESEIDTEKGEGEGVVKIDRKRKSDGDSQSGGEKKQKFDSESFGTCQDPPCFSSTSHSLPVSPSAAPSLPSSSPLPPPTSLCPQDNDGVTSSKRKLKKEKKKLERKQKKKESKTLFCSSHYFQPKLMHRLDRDTSG